MGPTGPVLSHKSNMKSPFLISLRTCPFPTLFVCLPYPWVLKMLFSPQTLQGSPPPGPSWESRRRGNRTGALHFMRFFLKVPAFLCPCLEDFYSLSQCFRSSYFGFPPLPFPSGSMQVHKSTHQQKRQLEVRTLKVNYKPVKKNQPHSTFKQRLMALPGLFH